MFAAIVATAGCGAAGEPTPAWHGRIVNAHEHIESFEQATRLLEVMDRLGIAKTVLVGSSRITLTLDHRDGFTGIDANNEELLEIVAAYPGRFEAWPTLDPSDPEKLDKLERLIARGATGVKLYLGHGLISSVTGDWMFRPKAIDDPGMLPVYAFCEQRFIPVCLHVNPGPKTPGFAQEFGAVLDRFPNLKVCCPHFMLSSIHDERLRELLDTYPNLYTDISFGQDQFLRAGLARISSDPDKFRRLFADYPDRFFYATDVVVTAARFKDAAWLEDRYGAYLEMLTKPRYTTPALPNQRLAGLALSDRLVAKILYRNYQAFSASRPRRTRIRGELDWRRMGVPKIERYPGELSPPP